MGWAGAGEGLGSPCVTLPTVWKQTELLISPNAALLCMARGCSTDGRDPAGPSVCVSLAWKGALALPNRAGSLEWANTARPRAGSITGSEESKVQVCLDLDLGVSFLELWLLMGSVCSEVLGEQSDNSVP